MLGNGTVADCPAETYLGLGHRVSQMARPTLQNSMQRAMTETWQPACDDSWSSARHDKDLADLALASPFVSPAVQLALAQIMQRNVAFPVPPAPTLMSPPRCWRPALPQSPKPDGHTLPAAGDGQFGIFPDTPLPLSLVLNSGSA